MAKTLKEIEKIVDDYEKSLRKQGYVVTYQEYNEVSLKLPKDKGLNEFFKEFFYYNHLERYDLPTTSFSYTLQTHAYNEKCMMNQRRSLGDLFRLARKYYNDNITLLDVMGSIYNLVQSNTIIKAKKANSYYGVLYTTICQTIHRRVFNIYFSKTERTTYKFDDNNSDYKQSSYLSKDILLLGEDYNTLFNTIAGKSFLKNKREKGFTLQVSPQEELDRAVLEKLAKMEAQRNRPLETEVLIGKTSKKSLTSVNYRLLNDDYSNDF